MLLRIASMVVLTALLAWSQDAGVVRVSEEDARKLVVTRVEPEYPAIAKKMNLAGRVVVDVYVDEDGKVEKAQPLNGNPLLSGAAVSAVKNGSSLPSQPAVKPRSQ